MLPRKSTKSWAQLVMVPASGVRRLALMANRLDVINVCRMEILSRSLYDRSRQEGDEWESAGDYVQLEAVGTSSSHTSEHTCKEERLCLEVLSRLSPLMSLAPSSTIAARLCARENGSIARQDCRWIGCSFPMRRAPAIAPRWTASCVGNCPVPPSMPSTVCR